MTVAIIYDKDNNVDALLAKMLDFIVLRLVPDRIKSEDVRTEEKMPSDNRQAILYTFLTDSAVDDEE